jgi:hypothetical protein
LKAKFVGEFVETREEETVGTQEESSLSSLREGERERERESEERERETEERDEEVEHLRHKLQVLHIF